MLKLIEDFHNCKRGAGPEGKTLKSRSDVRSMAEPVSCIKTGRFVMEHKDVRLSALPGYSFI